MNTYTHIYSPPALPCSHTHTHTHTHTHMHTHTHTPSNTNWQILPNPTWLKAARVRGAGLGTAVLMLSLWEEVRTPAAGVFSDVVFLTATLWTPGKFDVNTLKWSWEPVMRWYRGTISASELEALTGSWSASGECTCIHECMSAYTRARTRTHTHTHTTHTYTLTFTYTEWAWRPRYMYKHMLSEHHPNWQVQRPWMWRCTYTQGRTLGNDFLTHLQSHTRCLGTANTVCVLCTRPVFLQTSVFEQTHTTSFFLLDVKSALLRQRSKPSQMTQVTEHKKEGPKKADKSCKLL